MSRVNGARLVMSIACNSKWSTLKRKDGLGVEADQKKYSVKFKPDSFGTRPRHIIEILMGYHYPTIKSRPAYWIYLAVLLLALPLALSSFRLLLLSELSMVGLQAGRVVSAAILLCPADDSVVVDVTGVEGLLMAPLYMLRNDEATAEVDVVSIVWSKERGSYKTEGQLLKIKNYIQ